MAATRRCPNFPSNESDSAPVTLGDDTNSVEEKLPRTWKIPDVLGVRRL